MDRLLRRTGLSMLLLLWATAASSQIISTSLPTATEGGAEKKVVYHLMAGYASWNFASIEQLKKDPNFSGVDIAVPGGILIAGDVAIKANENVSLGVGAFNNNFGLKIEEAGSTYADVHANMLSFYGNIFYQKVGVQVGTLFYSETDDATFFPLAPGESNKNTSTDFDFFLVGRTGGTQWTAGVGAGGYYYGGVFKETVVSAFANGSVKLAKGLSVDAGYWFLGESKEGGDSASRLSIGAGYSF